MGAVKMNSLSPPLSRNTDPASSHEGAVHVVTTGKLTAQLQEIYDALKLHPMHTARELSKASGIDYYLIQKRLSVLEAMGLAARRGKRICTFSKTRIKVQVWEAV